MDERVGLEDNVCIPRIIPMQRLTLNLNNVLDTHSHTQEVKKDNSLPDVHELTESN